MILAEIGGTIGTDAVLLDAHAVDVEAADDRPRGSAGAKLEPVMPGLSNSRSPSVEALLRRSSAFGTTVTVANLSVTIGSVPCNSPGPVPEDGPDDWTGLGAVTVTSGSATWACAAGTISRTMGETASSNRRRIRTDMRKPRGKELGEPTGRAGPESICNIITLHMGDPVNAAGEATGFLPAESRGRASPGALMPMQGFRLRFRATIFAGHPAPENGGRQCSTATIARRR